MEPPQKHDNIPPPDYKGVTRDENKEAETQKSYDKISSIKAWFKPENFFSNLSPKKLYRWIKNKIDQHKENKENISDATGLESQKKNPIEKLTQKLSTLSLFKSQNKRDLEREKEIKQAYAKAEQDLKGPAIKQAIVLLEEQAPQELKKIPFHEISSQKYQSYREIALDKLDIEPLAMMACKTKELPTLTGNVRDAHIEKFKKTYNQAMQLVETDNGLKAIEIVKRFNQKDIDLDTLLMSMHEAVALIQSVLGRAAYNDELRREVWILVFCKSDIQLTNALKNSVLAIGDTYQKFATGYNLNQDRTLAVLNTTIANRFYVMHDALTAYMGRAGSL
jgi:hypothetical protein